MFPCFCSIYSITSLLYMIDFRFFYAGCNKMLNSVTLCCEVDLPECHLLSTPSCEMFQTDTFAHLIPWALMKVRVQT